MKNILRLITTTIGSIFLVIVFSLAVMPSSANAYGRGGHEYIAKQAALLFEMDHGIFPALEQHIDWVAEHGARHEDEADHIWDHGGWCVTCTHFWDADDSDLSEDNYIDFCGECGNSYEKANELLDRSFQSFFNYDDYGWWEYLGHVTHLIGDMTVPAHAHVDIHPHFDSYDTGWIGWDDLGARDPNYTRFTAWDADDAGGLVSVPESVIQWIIDDEHQNGGYGLGYNEQTYAQLYYLMYTASQTGDYFPSDQDDGDSDDRHGWMMGYPEPPWPGHPRTTDDLDNNWWYEAGFGWVFTNEDGDYTRIGSTSFVYAIRAVAGLYLAFRDAFDPIPPTTSINLTYAEPPNSGWTKGDVTMVLAAQDEPQDNRFGVYHSYWTEGGDVHEYSQPVILTEEGIHEIEYWSIDNFGNVESRKTETVMIDKTGPVVLETSPEADGFYLTSDTLTISWSAMDELSGIAWDSADIDGTPVVQGQIIDLADMGGWHTLTLSVGDVAGNVTVETIEFSVKIHAAVDFKPDRLNLKSESDVVIVYVEFPIGYDVTPIDLTTVRLIPAIGWFLHAVPSPTEVKDYNHNKIPDRMVQFSREDTITALDGTTGNVEITVFGELDDATEFYGTEIIEVIGPGKVK